MPLPGTVASTEMWTRDASIRARRLSACSPATVLPSRMLRL
jgi:hypothetical protein